MWFFFRFITWEQRKLGEVANIQKGQQLGKAEMSNNGAFYVLNGGMEPSGYTNQLCHTAEERYPQLVKDYTRYFANQ